MRRTSRVRACRPDAVGITAYLHSPRPPADPPQVPPIWAAGGGPIVEKTLGLELPEDAYLGVPVWRGAQHWAQLVVPLAYDLWYSRIRRYMPNNGVSRAAVLAVADARARHADFATGRDCRPANKTLAEATGLSVRTVERATAALRLLGCATEVLRGRQRTRSERFASYGLGDRSRGWASVWALHPPRIAVDNFDLRLPVLSSHPRRGSCSLPVVTFISNSPTETGPQPSTSPVQPESAGWRPHKAEGASRPAWTQGQRRRPGADPGGVALAAAWLADGQTPPWAQRHSPRGWARMLAGPAAHGWTPEDVNLMLHEWVHVGGHWLPERPYKPIGVVGAALAWHSHLDQPPAAAQRRRDAEDRARLRAEQRRDRAQAQAARDSAASADQRAAAIAVFAAERARRRAAWSDPEP